MILQRRTLRVSENGGSGISKATAKLLAREGAKVAVIDKTSETLQQAVEEIGKYGEALAVQADLTDTMMAKQSNQMGVRFDEAIANFLEQNRPYLELKRRGKPEEVAEAIAFLSAEWSSFVLSANL